MNAAAAERLEKALAGGYARVRKVEVMELGAMVPSMVRRVFEKAAEVEENEDGLAALQPDGSWLWVDSAKQGSQGSAQPGGARV